MQVSRRKGHQQYLYLLKAKKKILHYYEPPKRGRKMLGGYIREHSKKDSNLQNQNNSSKMKEGKLLLQYLYATDDFPDNNLADSIEKASKEFRESFKLRD